MYAQLLTKFSWVFLYFMFFMKTKSFMVSIFNGRKAHCDATKKCYSPHTVSCTSNCLSESSNADDRDFSKTAFSGLKALVIECHDANGNNLEPNLVSEFLMEIGACSVSIVDSKRGTTEETPVYREPPTGGMTFDSSNTLKPDAIALSEDGWPGWPPRAMWTAPSIIAHIPTSWNSEEMVMMISSTFDLAVPPKFVVEDIQDKDWVLAVQESWSPIYIGDVCIMFPWHEKQRIAADSTQVLLQGGSAFGTGDHPTTRLCVKWIQDAMKQNPGASVLDYGSGSGILGIVALKFGAKKAVGVEIDRDAISVAIENCKNNGLEMEFFLPEEKSDESGLSVVLNSLKAKYGANINEEIKFDTAFDITVANILAGPLKKLAPTLAKLTRPGGYLCLSGIMDTQSASIIAVYSKYFDLHQTNQEDSWVLISGHKK